jgi:hypothetical protein
MCSISSTCSGLRPGLRADQFVDLLLGADVPTAGRMVEDHDPRSGVQPLGEHDLLLVAAGEVEAERPDAGRADAQPESRGSN